MHGKRVQIRPFRKACSHVENTAVCPNIIPCYLSEQEEHLLLTLINTIH